MKYDLHLAGEVVGRIETSWLGRTARLTCGDAAFELVRQGFGGARMFLMNGDQEVVSARKVALVKESYEVRLATTSLAMKREGGGILKRPFVMRTSDGREIGRVERDGWVNLKSIATLPEDWPVPVQAFILWIALTVWSRERSAATGG